MTVCLAAMCVGDDDGDGPMVVVAADRMVTLGNFIEFEHAIPKMKEPSPFGIVMIAGNTLAGTELAREVCETLGDTEPPMEAIARALATHFQLKRQQAVEDQILKPRGLDLGTFYANHASLNPNVTMMLDNTISEFNFGVELLLGGIDANGPHIYSVSNPGSPPMQHDVIGYASIGSGAIHALQSMIGFGHHSGVPLKDALFRSYASKRRAEAAPGVGLDTDIAVISRKGIRHLAEAQLLELKKLFDGFQEQTDGSLSDRLNDLTLEVLDDFAE